MAATPSDSWKSFAQSNFDKLLLVVIVLFMLVYQLHVLHDAKDSDAVHWAREQSNTFIGALVGLITGSRINSMVNNRGVADPQPATPPPPHIP